MRRAALSRRLSNPLDARFCVDVTNGAIAKYGTPGTLKADQGPELTGVAWIATLTGADVEIQVDGRDRYLDNIFIERLARSPGQNAVYLHELHGGFQAKRAIKDRINLYNFASSRRSFYVIEGNMFC